MLEDEPAVGRVPFSGQTTPSQSLAKVNLDQDKPFLASGVQEFDQVLGGGIVQSSVGLLGGEPGIGKSTFILQLLGRFALLGNKCLYVSGEETAAQIKLRADRLTITQEGIELYIESSLESIFAEIDKINPDFVVIDSIQSLYSTKLEAASGSVTQIRETTALITRYAKTYHKAFLLIGHVNKEGNLAGPKVIEHIVDYVLTLEGATNQNYRYLRALKNRYGNLNEVGFFRMTKTGLAEVKNPNLYLMERFPQGQMGSVIFPSYEGSRVNFVEIQALVSNHNENYTTRTSLGIDRNKLLILIAIMEKHLDINLSNRSIYLNIAGGMYVSDTAVDMAILGAIYSSYHHFPFPLPIAMMGEVSLSGIFIANKNLEEKIKALVQASIQLAYFSGKEPAAPASYQTVSSLVELASALQKMKKGTKPPKTNADN